MSKSLLVLFTSWHLNEVTVVILSHFIIHYKKLNNMEMIKAICVHILTGIFLTCLLSTFVVVVGPVGIGGELVNENIIGVMNTEQQQDLVRARDSPHSIKPLYSGFKFYQD